MMTAVLVLAGLAALVAILLNLAAIRLQSDSDEAVTTLDSLLPQLQCAQCGYPGCKPYAAAILDGEAEINQCAPGGEETILALARVLQREPAALNPDFGAYRPPAVAFIDESACIGCARCLDACPVDAILGAPRLMHTVIAAHCTGCELCLPPCPVDCISLINADGNNAT
jgi:electron transport complex protein RnfB